MNEDRSHPGWYGAVMGTCALCLAYSTEANAWNWLWLSKVAFAVLILASVLAIVLFPRYARRVRGAHDFRSELADPRRGALLATLPAGLMLLGGAWGRVGSVYVDQDVCVWIDIVLLTFGAILGVTLSTMWAASVLRAEDGLEGVNGAWMIPAVMNMMVPIGLTPIIAMMPAHAGLLLMIGFAFYGIGVILFLINLTLLVARLAIHDPFPGMLAPSLWIPLAGAGLIGLALLRLLQAAVAAGSPWFTGTGAGIAATAMGVGFGLWWAVFAAMEYRHINRSAHIPPNPSWWAFVFPVGSMTISIAALAEATDVLLIALLGIAATVLLTVVWAWVAARMLRMGRAVDAAQAHSV